MDDVFKALSDPTRRDLLDELFREDGQTLSALEARFSMTRFGIAKHLRILEDAGLVATRRRGREKLHFLNPVPIRLVHDRWVSKYAEPWAAALSDLKSRLESPMEKIFEIYIKTPPNGSGKPSRTVTSAASTSSATRCSLTGRPAAASKWAIPRQGRSSATAKTWKSTRRGGWCRPCGPSGARTSRPRAHRRSPGRSNRWAIPATSPSRTAT